MAGKYPQRFSSVKKEDPSALKEAVNKYLFPKFTLALPKKDCKFNSLKYLLLGLLGSTFGILKPVTGSFSNSSLFPSFLKF